MGSAGRLPADLTRMVGRVREVRDVRALLGRSRLVSVTGPGGVGKTRVAVQAARTAERVFADGVWFVGLSGLRDPALVAGAVAAAVGQDVSTLTERIAGWQALFVIDNCEHLVEACAVIIREILQSAPGIRILITSRERLGISGEHVLQVSPLAVPADELAASGPASLATCESVQLLVDRARAVQPGFAVTDANAGDVARLAALLDGLPLAIELAAARLSSMSVGQVAGHLAGSYRILRSRPRASPGRQASLEDTISWSYALCSPDEQQLWARMSIFAGPVDAGAVAAVCGAEFSGAGVDELLHSLVSKSIIVCDQAGVPRFRMLGAIRQYGRDRLGAVLAAELTDRHACHYEQLARAAADSWFGAGQAAYAEWLRTAMPDLRLALDHLLSGPEPGRGMSMAALLNTLWVCLGRLREGEIWLERALAVAPEPSPHALYVYGWVLLVTGQVTSAREPLQRALAAAGRHGDEVARDYAQTLLAIADTFEGRADVAIKSCRIALERRRRAGDLGAVAIILVLLGEICCAAGDVDAALECAKESERMCCDHGELWCGSYAMWVRALALCGRGRFDEAAEAARESLTIKIALDDSAGIMLVSEVFAWTMAATGKWEDAGQLYAAVQRRGGAGFFPLRQFGYLDAQRASWGTRIVAALGPDRYQSVAKAAGGMDLLDAGQRALGGAARSGAAVTRGVLTRRETEVAELVAEGLGNRDIAARLVISPRTAEVHVERILVKLGFSRRAQIAAWWHDLPPAP